MYKPTDLKDYKKVNVIKKKNVLGCSPLKDKKEALTPDYIWCTFQYFSASTFQVHFSTSTGY